MNGSRTHRDDRSGAVGAILTYGFATAVLVWTVWYITHLPWLDLAEKATLPVILLSWLIGAIAAGQEGGARAGLGSGVVTALLGLMVVGSRLTAPAGAGAAGMKPGAALIVVGFLVLGAAVGVVGGAAGSFLAGRGPGSKGTGETPVPPVGEADWLARFAVVAAAAVAPLLFIGGMVTSTNSGMAVPDWPNTFGSNMFLYPLGPRATPEVFLEHSHRLFGALVGLTTLTLSIWVLAADARRWVRVVALVVFLVVCLQGALGGVRVRLDDRVLAMAHGILAQLTFATLLALAAFLSPTWRNAAIAPEPVAAGKRLRIFSTGLVHSALLQLLLGAAYRHFRDSHSLWTHAGFSLVVLVLALMAGFAAAALDEEFGGIGPVLRTCGRVLIAVVAVQFVLGWATFALSGRGVQADTPAQALLRTAHQANGGLLLGVAVLTFFWTRRLLRLTVQG